MNILLQATGMGSLLGTATSSISYWFQYLPEALLIAVVFAFGLVYMQRKKAAMGTGIPGISGVSASSSVGGQAKGGIAMNPNVSLMFVYSQVQRRVVAARPFQIERMKDKSGNILEKKAVFLDTMQKMDRMQNVFNVLGRFFPRMGTQQPEDDGSKESVNFDERLAVGAPNGGWYSTITLEENAQIPMYPDRSTNESMSDTIKRVTEQYDKRISRLKEGALSINQYAANANSQFRQLFGKEMVLIGILILVGLLVIFYGIQQLATAIHSVTALAPYLENLTKVAHP
jgi:hypothetical protein